MSGVPLEPEQRRPALCCEQARLEQTSPRPASSSMSEPLLLTWSAVTRGAGAGAGVGLGGSVCEGGNESSPVISRDCLGREVTLRGSTASSLLDGRAAGRGGTGSRHGAATRRARRSHILDQPRVRHCVRHVATVAATGGPCPAPATRGEEIPAAAPKIPAAGDVGSRPGGVPAVRAAAWASRRTAGPIGAHRESEGAGWHTR
jgi:hypothetical protein